MHPLHWVAVVAGVLVCGWLVRMVVSSTRRLNQRIAELKEEEANRTGPPEDPYMAFARLYAEDAAQKKRPPRQSK
jgi:hypothetical protein